jgi:hypothetical protein
VLVSDPSAPAPGWFNEVAAFLGLAYLRNAFTDQTEHAEIETRLASVIYLRELLE